MKKSVDISNLRMRETAAWKVLDWAMSAKNEDGKIKVDASKFILSRLYSEKHLVEGPGKHGEFLVTVEISDKDEDQATQLSGNRISKYIEV